MNTKLIKIKNRKIPILIAKNSLEKAKGYMFKKKPKKCEGILFLNKHKVKGCFWMPFVNFNLQLLFINEKNIIKEKYILKANDLKNVCSENKYKLALELASCINVKIGEKIELL